MKIRTSLFAICFLTLATQALALAPTPIIRKSNYTGFTAPEFTRFEQCEVYVDKVVITKQFGSTKIIETRALQTSGLHELVTAAKAEPVKETPNFLCDGPSTTIDAFENQANDQVERVELFSTGGCGSPSRNREGNQAETLRNIMALYCPTTYKFNGQE